jgi:hypothetical protein
MQIERREGKQVTRVGVIIRDKMKQKDRQKTKERKLNKEEKK